jgi:hypothetical protein
MSNLAEKAPQAEDHIERPEIIEQLADAVADKLIKQEGLAIEYAAKLGRVAADVFWVEYSGTQPYVPQPLAKIHAEIYERMSKSGADVEAIAEDYGYTVRHVRSIFSRLREEEQDRLQPGLFDTPS